jgi:hypothetical protein
MNDKNIKRTITIPDDSYQKVKNHCDKNDLKIARFVEKVLLYYINEQKNKEHEQK